MCKGPLSLDGNQTLSVKAKEGLTVRLTSRAGAKAGLSDPTVPCGRAVAQRTKVTLGISLWSRLTVRLRQEPGELRRPLTFSTEKYADTQPSLKGTTPFFIIMRSL